jgi:hypothetical protein
MREREREREKAICKARNTLNAIVVLIKRNYLSLGVYSIHIYLESIK